MRKKRKKPQARTNLWTVQRSVKTVCLCSMCTYIRLWVLIYS